MDNVVYDMASQSEVPPSFFVKKDYLSILDNSNGNYSSNQLVIDTSQLSNSNKWISYREGFLLMPLLLSMTSPISTYAVAQNIDFSVSLKNWYGTIIHSISLDLQGSTIIQQTPFQSLWNCFKLLTTLSYQSLITEGPTLGFYPDTSTSWRFNAATTVIGGNGTCNNSNFFVSPVITGAVATVPRDAFNKGFYERQRVWNINPEQTCGVGLYSTLLTQTSANTIYKSGVFKRFSSTGAVAGVWQCQIQAAIFLRHLHSFFDKAPLMKGIFFRMTLNLNNATVLFTTVGASTGTQLVNSVSVPVGGVLPFMISSTATSNGLAEVLAGQYSYNLSVGDTCLDATMRTAGGANMSSGINKNVTLNVPAYTFNPIFESAYISNSVRKIIYEDIYQYQVLNVKAGAQFNNLITNGIAGLKSCLVLPFFNATATNSNIGALAIPPFQSPWDPCGGGPTSPMAMINNFNVVVSGQNVLYNNQRYTYENFIQQLNGQNAINGNLVDGMGSSLISQVDFENTYCYYYVDVSRCLPIEVGVSKSVNIIGQNMSVKDLDLYVFLSYECAVSIDILVGSRL